MALPYRGIRSGQDLRWLRCQIVRNCFHQEDTKPNQSNMLLEIFPPEDDQKEDDRGYDRHSPKEPAQRPCQDFG